MNKNTEKKIDINTLNKLINARPVNTEKHSYTFSDATVTVVVDPDISAAKYGIMIESAANMCFSENGTYYSALTDFSKYFCVIKTFTNIKTENAQTIYKLIKRYPEIVTDILNDINKFYPNIDRDIKNATDYKLKLKLRNTKWEALAERLTEVADTIGATSESIPPELVKKTIDSAVNVSADKTDKAE